MEYNLEGKKTSPPLVLKNDTVDQITAVNLLMRFAGA